MSDSIDSLPSPTQLEFHDNLDTPNIIKKINKVHKLFDINKNSVIPNDISNIKKKKKKKKKCKICKKKLGLVPFKCKCNNIYCSLHRYAEDHNCVYNYKDEYQKNFSKNNPKVIAEKVPKI